MAVRAKVTGIVLAAGRSRRFGPRNKMLEPIDGVPLVRKVATAVLGGGVDELVVVTGYDPKNVRKALSGIGVRFVSNLKWRRGMGTSIAAGARAADASASGLLIVPGDLFRLTASHVAAVVAAFKLATPDHIAVSDAGTHVGSPVVFGAPFRDDLAALSDDEGGRSVLAAHPDSWLRVPCTPAEIEDLDEPLVV